MNPFVLFKKQNLTNLISENRRFHELYTRSLPIYRKLQAFHGRLGCEDGREMFLRNVGKHLQDYSVLETGISNFIIENYI